MKLDRAVRHSSEAHGGMKPAFWFKKEIKSAGFAPSSLELAAMVATTTWCIVSLSLYTLGNTVWKASRRLLDVIVIRRLLA
jgi:hypothetical protein